MINNNYDVGIVGAGVAGTFAAYRLAKENKNLKCILFDIGRPPAKRRRQMEGFLGCLPNSDGKFYLSDIDKITKLVGGRKAKSGLKFVNSTLGHIDTFKIIKDKSPSVSTEKKLAKLGWEFSLNDYMQMYPKEIHSLSKYISQTIESAGSVVYHFDEEIVEISKQKNMFVVRSELQEYRCKKLLIAVGRSGWRWAQKVFSTFGIIENNDTARFGIRVELPAQCLKDFNKSNCTLNKGNYEVGPLSWFGSVIQEDQLDMAISSFRSNESRWKTDKVSFNLIGNIESKGNGFEETDRIGKLTCVLVNDRVTKEKISTFLQKKSKIKDMREYDWLPDAIQEVSHFMPDILAKGYYHVPTITPLTAEINIGDNLETEVDGMFVAGESAGVPGLLAAAASGALVADSIVK